jgi:hypothetical protein
MLLVNYFFFKKHFAVKLDIFHTLELMKHGFFLHEDIFKSAQLCLKISASRFN